MKRPRSDVVMRRFLRGESVEDIVADLIPWEEWPRHVPRVTELVEAALRRAMLKSEKRRKR